MGFIFLCYITFSLFHICILYLFNIWSKEMSVLFSSKSHSSWNNFSQFNVLWERVHCYLPLSLPALPSVSSSLSSLSVYPQPLLFFDYWTISWYEFASRCNFDFMSCASVCSLLNNLNICNYDILFFCDYLKCETRAASKLTSALFGSCVVLDASPSSVIIFYCG